MYGLPQNYNPFGPHGAKPSTDALPDVPLHVFRAAQDVHATHLSADGQRVYKALYGEILVAKWQAWPGVFGAWQSTGEDDYPADAVRM